MKGIEFLGTYFKQHQCSKSDRFVVRSIRARILPLPLTSKSFYFVEGLSFLSETLDVITPSLSGFCKEYTCYKEHGTIMK